MLSTPELHFALCGALALFILGMVPSYLARSQQQNGEDMATRLEKVLPGVQCAQCGFPGCRAYAEALASGNAACNKCTPGGAVVTEQLAQILGISIPTEDNDDAIFTPRTVALIHESLCTGCGKCTRHCPVDAICGAIREPHQIVVEDCIGCGDCLKCCPEQCIELVRLEPTTANFNWELQSIRFQGSSTSK